MNSKGFVDPVVKSLESITKPYRQPYEDVLYERILCYEFYHRFRSRMEDSCSFVLHGELEKGCRDIDEIPDFVFHVPGSDGKNLASLEFKSTNYSMTELVGDLRKLLNFRSDPLRYQLGVFVLFGPKEILTKKFNELRKPDGSDNVELVAIAYDIQSGKVLNIKQL